MARQGKNEWWAVIDPNGKVLDETLFRYKGVVMSIARNKIRCCGEGYRVVKVRITEIKEWGEE